MMNQKKPAGPFTGWLTQFIHAQTEKTGMEVPCGECTDCCKSSQFIHIWPEETGTLARIPAEYLFPAPRMPKGVRLMGYDENGRCPMFKNSRCAIYENRPLTCRSYDCRVFTAAGLRPEDNDSPIMRQVERWEFEYPEQKDRDVHAAVVAAAEFLKTHRSEFPDSEVPEGAAHLAITALYIHSVFLDAQIEGSTDSQIAESIRSILGKPAI